MGESSQFRHKDRLNAGKEKTRMEDNEILDLYFARDEKALEETDGKYGKRLKRLSCSVTGNDQDAEECVNDTYLEAWNRIPPTRPEYFFAWLSKVARNLSYKVWEKQNAAKRSATVCEITDELSECIPSDSDILTETEEKRLASCINTFVLTLDKDARLVFMRRYFWSHSVAQISEATGFSQSKVKSMLFRARNRLKKVLEKENFTI